MWTVDAGASEDHVPFIVITIGRVGTKLAEGFWPKARPHQPRNEMLDRFALDPASLQRLLHRTVHRLLRLGKGDEIGIDITGMADGQHAPAQVH